jgi:hypothetical protein
MKKLLLTIAAVVGTFVAGSGTAWANVSTVTTDTIYSWIGGATSGTEKGGTILGYVYHKAVDATETTEAVAAYYEQNNSTDINVVKDSYYSLQIQGKYNNLTTTNYVEINLDNALKAGDVISVTAFRDKEETTTAKYSTPYFIFDTGNTITLLDDTKNYNNLNSSTYSGGVNGTEPNTQTYTVTDAAAGSKYIKIVRKQTSTNLYITSLVITREVSSQAATPTYSFSDLDITTRTYDLTLKCATEESTIYYSSDKETWKAYSSPITVQPGSTIYAKATAEGLEESAVAEITVPSVQSAELTETTPAGAEATAQVGKSYTIAADWMKGSANGNITGIKFKNAGFKIDVNEGYIITAISGYIGGNSKTTTLSAITVDDSSDNILESAIELPSTKSGTAKSDFATFTVKDLNATTSINFTFSSGSDDATQCNAQFTITYKLADQPELVKTVTFGDVPFATLYVEKDVVVPSDVAVYTGALSESKEYFNLTQVTTGVIPAKTGVILEGTAGASADFYTTTHTNVAAVESVLSGTTAETAVEDAYVLSYNTGKEDVGFYKYTGTVPANKAYLVVAASEAPVFRFNFGAETDEVGNVSGINAVTIENRTDNVIYDLSGRRVLSLNRPGLYIVNGKKVAIK